MNVRLLRRVKKHILEVPRRLSMDRWIQRREDGATFIADNRTYMKFAKCGTAGCIAGWACVLSGERGARVAELRGAELLRLGRVQGERLFYVPNWPDNFAVRYGKAKTQKQRAKIAAERIEHFISTKGAE